MLALVLDGEPVLRSDHLVPARGPGEARVRVRAAGVCDTDLQLVRGYMAYRGVLGHEFVGEVLEADSPEWIGKRVVSDINAGCGRCADCRENDGHHCRERTVLGIVGRDGAFAEELVVPERCLVAVPESVGDDQAVFAEPLAAALHVLDDVEAAADPIVVLGDGKLGLLTALALTGAGRAVTLVGHHPSKLAIAERAGARVALEADLGDAPELVPAVVEASGSESGMSRALSLLRPRGTLILKTTVAGPMAVDWSPVVIHELRVVGSRCGSMARAVEWLDSGRIDPTPLIAARFPLARADVALRKAAERGTLKVLVAP